MHLILDDFFPILQASKLGNVEKALAILWYHDRKERDVCIKPSALAKTIHEAGIGNPNPTALARGLQHSGHVLTSSQGVRLKHAARTAIRNLLPDGIDGMQPALDHAEGYVPEAIWKDTRTYVEAVCRQLNGCYRHCYYDAALVMLRRLVETLVIEAYITLARDREIKDADDNFFMLQKLVDRASGHGESTGLHLGRDAKKTLKRVKEAGDKSAHNRRTVAGAVDLTEIQSGVRTTVQELIQIAFPKRSCRS